MTYTDEEMLHQLEREVEEEEMGARDRNAIAERELKMVETRGEMKIAG